MTGVLGWAQAICVLLLLGIGAAVSTKNPRVWACVSQHGAPPQGWMRLQRKRNETSDDFVSGGQMVSGAESVLCSEHGMEAGHPGLEWKKQFGVPHTSLASANQNDQFLQKVDSIIVKNFSNTDYSVRSIQEYEDSMTAKNGNMMMGAQSSSLIMYAREAMALDFTMVDPGSCNNGTEESSKILLVQTQQARTTGLVKNKSRLTRSHAANLLGRFSSTCIAGQQNALKASQ